MKTTLLSLAALALPALALLPGTGRADVTPLDTFTVDVVGFNASSQGAYIAGPFTATFGLTQTFAGTGPTAGQTVTVTSLETIGVTTTTDTFTISVPTNFVPTGTTIGAAGTAVTNLQFDLGNANSGSNMVAFLTAHPTVSGTGSLLFSGGTLALTPTVTLSNGNMAAAAVEGVNAGGSDLAPFAIRSFTINLTYATVPEPSTWAMMVGGLGVLVLLQRRRQRTV